MRIRKYFSIKLLKFIALFFAVVTLASAADMTSTNFILRDPVIGTGGGYGSSTNFQLLSEGDKTLTGVGSSASFIGHYGFLYYPFATAAVLTATPNGIDADLSWIASDAGQGWTVDGYNTGKSSVSGGPYTYTDVGNVTAYTYEALAPGDYCFVVETYDALGYVIATSNEDCLTIDPIIVFDLDTEPGGGNGESSAPYAVALGTVTVSDTRVSGTGDAVEMIVVEGHTNGPGGMVVSIRNANGASGLVSTSVPADTIGSADGTMADGTENYGLCVATSGLTGFTISTPYASNTCATDSETNDVEGLTTSGENILDTGGVPVASAHAEVIVNSAINSTTPAHADYTDTLTFIMTGTF